MLNSRKKLLTSALAMTLLPCTAFAQLEEIIVTAQKRSQDINDVGMSISAATGQQLANIGVSDVADLVKVTPGLTYTVSQNGTPLFTLRGVGFNDYTPGASPAVSVYVDEVPLAYGAFTKGVTLDLERVEVLKGPQGILFGQNSTGGAINYIAAKPSQDFEAGVKGSYGRFNRVEYEGFLSGGLSDTLSGRVALSGTNSDDWQRSTTSNQELGEEQVFRGRAQLLWEPTETATVLLGLNGWTDKSDTQAGQLQGLALQIADPATALLADIPETQRRIDAFNALTNAGDNARDADWDHDRDLSRDDNFYQVSLRADFELTDTITLTSITAYSEFEEDYAMDRDSSPLKNAGINMVGSVESFSQELRLAGSTDNAEWLLGANYATNDVKGSENILTGDSTNTAILPGGPWIGDSSSVITQDITDIGIFANVEYSVTEKTTILAGARYAENENDYSACLIGHDLGMRATFPFFADVLRGLAPSGYIAQPDECLALNSAFELSSTPTELSLDEDNVSWRVGLNHNATETLLLYGLISEGYKTGSFPILPASAASQYNPVTQESVLAYELGFKWSFPDQGIQFNGAVFSYEYEDKQVRGIVKDPVFNQLDRLVNVPESSIQGIEFDLTMSPMDGLLVRLSGTYVDTEVDEFYTFVNALTGETEPGINGARVQGDFSGSELPYTPDLHFVADIDYRWGISANLNAFVGANMIYNSEANSTFGDPADNRIDAYTTLDLRAGIEAPDGQWSASVWGRNVTDEYYWTNQFYTQDAISRFAAKPATYGVAFSYNF
ncbi:MAG: TonB-dependent receptor [Porticoccaceae bacterium]|nr:TonB-dependent receptor [Porticoccaceae bacterium]